MSSPEPHALGSKKGISLRRAERILKVQERFDQGAKTSEIAKIYGSPRIDGASALVFCPSNPWVSIDPILAIPGYRSSIKKKTTIAVSPIIGGKTVKGPAAKMFSEMGIEPSALAVAEHYQGLISGFVMDNVDSDAASHLRFLGIETFLTDTLMETIEDRRRLAQDVLHLIERLI